MYGGQVAETGSIAQVVGSPRHHYTRGLLGAVLSLEGNDAKLTQIRGVVPSPAQFDPGCRFAGRCPAARAICHSEPPLEVGDQTSSSAATSRPSTS